MSAHPFQSVILGLSLVLSSTLRSLRLLVSSSSNYFQWPVEVHSLVPSFSYKFFNSKRRSRRRDLHRHGGLLIQKHPVDRERVCEDIRSSSRPDNRFAHSFKIFQLFRFSPVFFFLSFFLFIMFMLPSAPVRGGGKKTLQKHLLFRIGGRVTCQETLTVVHFLKS